MGSFGSFGSIKSHHQNSKHSSNFHSSAGEELLIKSAMSAKDQLNKKDKFRQNSVLDDNYKQKLNKFSKQRGKIINSYFREAESLGHDSGSNKISNLINQLGHGAQSEYSGQSFKPVETSQELIPAAEAGLEMSHSSKHNASENRLRIPPS